MESAEMKPQTTLPDREVTEPACCATESASGRWKLWLMGVALLAIALALYNGWGWLVATGAASVLLSLAPCLAMCALGLCMRGKKSS